MQIHPAVFKVQRALRVMIEKLGTARTYILAVSGGADSMALAHAACVLTQQGCGRYVVCHVEHGLRGEEALRDMELVRSFCEAQGLAFTACHVDVRHLAQEHHLSTESAARQLRYEALHRVAAANGAQYILTAHHADDQAETVLLKLLRGSGLDGLSGMRAEHGDTIIRPFLKLGRSDLEAYCALTKIAYCHDSTNDDTHYTRNRVRRELLPYLHEHFNPNIRETLQRTAEQLAEDADCLAQLAQQAYEDALQSDNDGITLSCTRLCRHDIAIQKRVLRLAYFALGGSELSYERTQALLELCSRRTGGKVIQLSAGIEASYKANKIIFTRRIHHA